MTAMDCIRYVDIEHKSIVVKTFRHIYEDVIFPDVYPDIWNDYVDIK